MTGPQFGDPVTTLVKPGVCTTGCIIEVLRDPYGDASCVIIGWSSTVWQAVPIDRIKPREWTLLA